MLKTALIMMAVGFATIAHADDFVCTIRVNEARPVADGGYLATRAVARSGGWTCSGGLEFKRGQALVLASIFAWNGLEVDQRQSTNGFVSFSFQDKSEKGEPLDRVTCQCGLE